MIVLHIGEVDACMGEVAAHAQVERIDEHLVAKTTGHFYETHRLYSSELSRIWCRHFEQRCRHFFGYANKGEQAAPDSTKNEKRRRYFAKSILLLCVPSVLRRYFQSTPQHQSHVFEHTLLQGHAVVKYPLLSDRRQRILIRGTPCPSAYG